jgi:hypothetical protein
MKKAVNDLEELFRDLYHKEHERRRNLSADLALPLTMVSLVIGLLSYYVTNFPRGGVGFATVAFLVSVAFVTGFMISVVVMTVNVFHDKPYKYIARPAQIQAHYDALKDFCTDENQTLDEVQLREEFSLFMVHQYRDAAEQNTADNDQKSERLSLLRSALIGTIICALVSLVPYFFAVRLGDTQPPAAGGLDKSATAKGSR